MKFLIDNPLSPVFCEKLRDFGLDVVHVRDLGLERAKDEEIFQMALKENRAIISADTDFGTILARTGMERPSVVIFRCLSPRRPPEQAELFIKILPRIVEDLKTGSIVIVEDTRIRIRKLPVL